MTTNRRAVPVLAAGVLGAVTTVVLRRMETEYSRQDTLTKPTVAAMYATYTAHAAVLAWAGARRVWPVPLPPRSSGTAGTALALTGAGCALAGARPFGAGAQLSGIDPGTLHATGIYRYSRNPQYLGLVMTSAGVALARRSAAAGLLALGVWLAYRRWIPSEESHLARTFGDRYVTYKSRVPRWLGNQSTYTRKP